MQCNFKHKALQKVKIQNFIIQLVLRDAHRFVFAKIRVAYKFTRSEDMCVLVETTVRAGRIGSKFPCHHNFVQYAIKKHIEF